MPRAIVVLLAVVALFVASLPLRADAPSAKEQALTREIAELKSQVEALRAEIKALKTMVQALSDRQAILHTELRFVPEAVPANPVLPPTAPSDQMPEGTVRRQFNGSTLYIVPLTSGASTKPAR
jgi:hypothetical protein